MIFIEELAGLQAVVELAEELVEQVPLGGAAADLLGVGRPTLIKMLDDGKLPYERPAGHRRPRLEDVLAYRARRRAERERNMTELVRQTEQLGLYEDAS